MYGVPEGLDLSFLHGRELIQVCLGQYEIQFRFHPDGELAVGGDWELLGADNAELDRGEPAPRTAPYQLHRLLGQRVATTEISAPKWIALRFENGEVLRVFDNSQQYESFTIQPGDIVV